MDPDYCNLARSQIRSLSVLRPLGTSRIIGMDLDGREGPGVPASAPSVETVPGFWRLSRDNQDATLVRDAVFDLTGVQPEITSVVASILGDGEPEPLHSHNGHYFAVCRTPIRGAAFDARGNEIKKIDFGAGDVIAFDPLPADKPHRLRLTTGGNQAAISYVAYKLPPGTAYPQPGLYKPAAAA